MDGKSAADKLGCNKQEKVEAVQIGPFIRGSEDIRPTVKHSCKQTILAASIRACSNKIKPDPNVLNEWKQHFDQISAQFLKAIKKEAGLIVDLEEWLQKYPIQYRNKIRLELEGEDLFTKTQSKTKYRYDSFPKKELQISEVAWEYIGDVVNKCKERQISGPSTQKKIAANAFIYALEGVAHRFIPEYCGRKDWQDICESIIKKEALLVNPIYGFADGSGFDMTQTKEIQKRFTTFIKLILDTCSISLPIEINKNNILDAIRGSETLHVDVAQGAVSYEAEGRASGDGWTTFGNTLLMISYWTFIFMKANVPKTRYFLLVKGDDVLFAVERQYQAAVKGAIEKYMANENQLVHYGLGQIVKFVKWGNIEDGDFLSNMFFRTRDGLRMTRIPFRVFQTMPWSLKTSLQDKNYSRVSKELIYSKGCSLLAWSEGLPIFEKLARKLMAIGKPGPNSEFNQYADADRVWYKRDETDYVSCLNWLDYRFGVTLGDVAAIEEAIDAIDDQVEEVIIPVLDKFYL
jgi:hypothetical protein